MSIYDEKDEQEKTRPEQFSLLVVDDDAMVRAILMEYLKKFGFKQVREAPNGKKALFILNEPGDYDLVISDWEMPEADGLTLLKAVRKHPRHRDTKFMLITSQTSQERQKISKAAQWKVDSYVVKPFRGDELKKKVFAVLGLDSAGAKRAG